MVNPWGVSKNIWFVVVLIPPPEVCGLPSNWTSLKVFEMEGLRTQPVPFPPVTSIDTTLEILKLYVSKSTKTVLAEFHQRI